MSQTLTRYYREKLGFTQQELAEKANLSLRTIQRLEAGSSIPKGHTLKVLAEALKVDKSNFLEIEEGTDFAVEDNKEEISTLRFLNLSVLSFIGIPYGNLIFPVLIWRRKRQSEFIDEHGRRIINIQIIWSMCMSLALISAPFIQKQFSLNIPLIILVLVIGYIANAFIILKTAKAIQKNSFDFLKIGLRFI
ncbi:MAG: helix-turn-helix domain-containing protein [Bacteroidota bacterium]